MTLVSNAVGSCNNILELFLGLIEQLQIQLSLLLFPTAGFKTPWCEAITLLAFFSVKLTLETSQFTGVN